MLLASLEAVVLDSVERDQELRVGTISKKPTWQILLIPSLEVPHSVPSQLWCLGELQVQRVDAAQLSADSFSCWMAVGLKPVIQRSVDVCLRPTGDT